MLEIFRAGQTLRARDVRVHRGICIASDEGLTEGSYRPAHRLGEAEEADRDLKICPMFQCESGLWLPS